MARKKQRVSQHIMEDGSFDIIKKNIPKDWVIREFNKPDYGIDLVIELFDKINSKFSEVLGEFIFVQAKSVNKIQTKKEKIYAVQNVNKGKWIENRTEYMEIEVVKYVLDTNTIYTIQSLGASVSVLLFLVDLQKEDVYFISLNDYVDKIILPKKPNYDKQKTLTLTIPKFNNLKNKDFGVSSLKFYAKRAKFLSAFAKFSYQKNELSYLLGFKDFPDFTQRDKLERTKSFERNDIVIQILYFINQIEDLDIWNYQEWIVLPQTKIELQKLKEYLEQEDFDIEMCIENTIITWHRLTNLGTMYEELCREWFLPKLVSLMTSYPSCPDIIKEV